jgi:CRISPR-associated endonuclease/helicase Cas3
VIVANSDAAAVAASDQRAVDWLKCALGLEASEAPFPWQIDLLQRLRRGEVVSALDIPTGLGKTAVMAVWLVARALGASLPRRLVYVVDRRAVVDQATDVAESLRAWVANDRAAADALGLGARPLPISTLRGQYVDNRAWLEDPSSPAIVVGTIDMVGSRLLFSGYGVSSKMRPYHAGLLGADTLVVLDEAHLVPAFEDLLRQIEHGADSFGPNDPPLCKLVPPFKALSLSATGRQTDCTALTLSEKDRRNPVVAKRLTAKKTLALVELADLADEPATDGGNGAGAGESDEAKKKSKGPKLAAVLARQAWELTEHGSVAVRCLVFCNARKDATAVAAGLRDLAKLAGAAEPTVELFVGGRRVRERMEARDGLARLGFLAGIPVKLERAAFLIATSAGEVGVDLDADHMVCDLVPWERMVQRLGRVNRRGDGDSKVIVVVESEPTPSDGVKKAIEKRDASRDASKQIDERTKRLRALEGEKASLPKGQKKSAEAKAAEETRKQAEKELKKSISAHKKRVQAFKDADARIAASHEAEVAQHRSLRRLLKAVEDGDGSLSPHALLCLRERQDLAAAVPAATTVEPLRPELARALIDSWSMTSLEEHPGRPEVDPWLRGFRPNDPPQTKVVWRRHLPVRSDGSLEAKSAKGFMEAAPPHTSEELETETYLVLDWLVERAASVSEAKGGDGPLDLAQVVAIALGARGELREWLTLGQLAAAKSKGKNENKEAKKARDQAVKDLEQVLAGATVLIDARLGGLTDGLLDNKADTVAVAADDNSGWLARPDAAGVPVTGFRIRELGAGQEGDADTAWATTPGGGWIRRHVFVTKVVDGEPSEALAIDGWAGEAATEDDRAEADRSQQLRDHQDWAEECAREIAQRLGLQRRYEDLLALSARLHDGGKDAPRWQGAFRAPTEGRPYAKTKGPIDFDLLDGYRHELGSLPYVEADDEFKALGADDQDFVLHLIAAHHGFARPVIGTSGCDDAPPSMIEERARAVALRFARLSRRWGPWGLAWWEALVRAADQTASRRNQHPATARKEHA